jgi:hypothetical protein
LVAPNAVGSILTVGKSVGALEGRNVGLDVVCEGTGLGRSVRASDGAGVGLKVGLSVTGGKTVGLVLETKVGPSEAAVVGKLVGPFDGTVVGLSVAPNSVGSILTVGRFVDSTLRFVLGAKVVPPLEVTVGRSLEATVGNSLA